MKDQQLFQIGRWLAQQDRRTGQETGILCMLIKTFYSTLDNHRITVQSRITGQDRRQVHAHKDIFWTMDSQQDHRTEQETCSSLLEHNGLLFKIPAIVSKDHSGSE